MMTVERADITRISADAIVNAANTSLMGGGGVDGAIHRAGGPQIMEECMAIRRRQGECPVGEAVITTAGKLPAKFVIHAVGPVWRGGNHRENELLGSAYQNSLQLADRHQLARIAFPNISTGVYGFPKERAVKIAVETVTKFLFTARYVKDVIFVCFDEENYQLYEKLLNKKTP